MNIVSIDLNEMRSMDLNLHGYILYKHLSELCLLTYTDSFVQDSICYFDIDCKSLLNILTPIFTSERNIMHYMYELRDKEIISIIRKNKTFYINPNLSKYKEFKIQKPNEEKKEEKVKDLTLHTEILDYLNNKTGSRYKVSTGSTLTLIDARIKEGYKLEDFIRVINLKHKQWSNDIFMSKYLRPSTLFNKTKFTEYAEEREVFNNNNNNLLESVKQELNS